MRSPGEFAVVADREAARPNHTRAGQDTTVVPTGCSTPYELGHAVAGDTREAMPRHS